MDITVGKKFRNSKGTKCHVVNIFNDNGKTIITYKYWMKRKKIWVYETDFLYLFLIGFEYGWEWD